MLKKCAKISKMMFYLLGMLILLSWLGFSFFKSVIKPLDLSKFHGTVFDKPRAIKSFVLTGIDKQPFDNEHLKGQWTMLFFGFTSCATICPLTMAELAKMYRLLEEKGVKPRPKVVMVSVDPARDNLKKISHYVKAFHPAFYGATGDQAQIKVMASDLGIAYEKGPPAAGEKPQDYSMVHSGTVMLFDPHGNLRELFTQPQQASWLAQDYLLFVS